MSEEGRLRVEVVYEQPWDQVKGVCGLCMVWMSGLPSLGVDCTCGYCTLNCCHDEAML